MKSRRTFRWPTLLAASALLLIAAGPARAASRAANGTFKGKTAHGLPMGFRLVNGQVRSFNLTIHALCMTAVSGETQLDSVVHHILPPAMALKGNGAFAKESHLNDSQSTHYRLDGRVSGRSASGHFFISYDFFDGFYFWSCEEQGTWKAARS